MALSPRTITDQQRLKGELQKKHAKIRAIDQGTYYDIPGKLRKMAREIERGERGDIRDAVLLLNEQNTGNGSNVVHMFRWGTDIASNAHWMLCTAKNRIEPA